MKINLSSPGAMNQLSKLLKAQAAGIDKAILNTALRGTSIIKKRTQKGIGYVGGQFEKYSDSRAKARQERGLKTSVVDLMDTGKMLGSMQVRKSGRTSAQIYFVGAESNKKAYFNNRIRPFFGFNQSEANTLFDHFMKRLTK